MTTMWCRKCKGRILVDRAFCTETRLEIYCLTCGNRWFLKKDRNAFTKWLAKVEDDLERARNGSTFT